MFSDHAPEPDSGMTATISTVSFVALFSGIYGKENNCMSGIAMFILGALDPLRRTSGRLICHN
jgi:hypothetical protein